MATIVNIHSTSPATTEKYIIQNGKSTQLGLTYLYQFTMPWSATWVGIGAVSAEYIELTGEEKNKLSVVVTGTNNNHCGRIYVSQGGTTYWDPSGPSSDLRYAPYSVTNELMPVRYRTNASALSALPPGNYRVGFVIFNGNGSPETSHEERSDSVYMYYKNTLFSSTPITATIQTLSIVTA